MTSFQETLRQHQLHIGRTPLEVIQVNIGRLCNQACLHCHVEAGPTRPENMDERTVRRVIELIQQTKTAHTVDITGGAPELNPHFRELVRTARKSGMTVIDRCNLTVLFEPGQEETAHFLKEHGVHIIASLPCYAKENVEKQRGRGVFNKSIEALKLLNELGYGREGTGLKLDLVYNPTGPSLPPAQTKLEQIYRAELRELFGIEFSRLFTITNMPIKRFLQDLLRSGKYETYMDLLANSFNPHAAKAMMCRNLVSVSWSGELFDCDFNQMLELPLGEARTTIWDVTSLDELNDAKINFANHCFACAAGSGSSCSGAIA